MTSTRFLLYPEFRIGAFLAIVSAPPWRARSLPAGTTFLHETESCTPVRRVNSSHKKECTWLTPAGPLSGRRSALPDRRDAALGFQLAESASSAAMTISPQHHLDANREDDTLYALTKSACDTCLASARLDSPLPQSQFSPLGRKISAIQPAVKSPPSAQTTPTHIHLSIQSVRRSDI